MACIAVHAVVHIARDAVVLGIRRRRSVATGALENRVVRRIGVACCAHTIRATMVEREERVITGRQRSRQPRRGRVAGGAGGGPARSHVIGIRGAREVRLVAGVTCRRRSREHVIDVAFDAVHVDVCAGQRERRAVVVERCPGPCGCCMACIARSGETGRGMVRIRCSVPIGLVTAIAGGRQGCVVVVGVALRTGHCCMGSRKWKCGVVVIKRGRAPATRRVANRAIRRESRGHVVGVSRAREIRLMARVAGSRGVHVVIVGVALSACQRRVHSGKRIVGIRGVVEVDIGPVGRRMACVAGGREARCNVAGVRGSIPIRLVAAEAGGRQRRVVVVGVALRARKCGMSTGQRKHRSMIERRRVPGAGRVAQRAVGWKTGSNVIRISGARKIGLVASITGRRERRVVVIDVALRASHSRVRPS